MQIVSIALLLVTSVPTFAEGEQAPSNGQAPSAEQAPSPEQEQLAPQALEKFEADFRKFRYVDVIKDYEQLSPKDKALPLNCYRIAFARIRKHDFVNAEEPLKAAVAYGFKSYPGYPTPEALLKRVEKLKRLCPPFHGEYNCGLARIKVYARETPWLKSISSEFPSYLQRADQIFGSSAPPITFYFIEKFEEYKEFFIALFEVEGARPGQAGTGDYNVVVFTDNRKDGATPEKDLHFLRGCILHEYGHSLFNTIYGENYLRTVPNWLDEGMADEFARPYFEHKLFQHYRQQLAKTSLKEPPPTYQEMCKNLYVDSEDRYPFAHEMVASLVKDSGMKITRPLLLSARKLNGDFAGAIKEITGLTTQSLYEQTVNSYWKSKH